MKLKRRLQAVLLAGMMALTATTAAIPSFTTISAQAEDTNNDDWLHAVGSRLYDKDGNEVWLTGANWFGFNCGENCLHYLWSGDVDDMLSEVADRGIGIDPAIRDHIFERGITTKTRGDHGIGLYLIEHYVTQAGGTIEVADNSPRGAIFTLFIPADGPVHSRHEANYAS